MSINEDCPYSPKCELTRAPYFTLIAGNEVHRLCDGDCLLLWCGEQGIGAQTWESAAELCRQWWAKWWETEGPKMADVDPRDR